MWLWKHWKNQAVLSRECNKIFCSILRGYLISDAEAHFTVQPLSVNLCNVLHRIYLQIEMFEQITSLYLSAIGNDYI